LGKSRPEMDNQAAETVIVKALLLFSNGNVMPLSNFPKAIGRSDLIDSISTEKIRYVSRQHFWLKFENGRFTIQDFNSTNGTKINGIEIKGKGQHRLKNGDRVEVAAVTVFKFIIP
jgi:pSer/pThr/pTyr-binding forkhead associated (FHA) protein